MKKATCRDLRGVCDVEIFGETPEEMGDNCKKHVMEKIADGDSSHQEAINEMMKVSKEDQHKWFEEFKNNFANLPEA